MPDVIIKKPENAYEAGGNIFFGILYFLVDGKKGAIIGGWGSVLTIGGILWNFVGSPAVEAYITERVKVEVAKPISSQPTSSLSIMSQAFAGEKYIGDPINFGGHLWGYADTNYRAFKLYGEDVLMVYHIPHPDDPPIKFTPSQPIEGYWEQYKQQMKK